MGLYLLLHGVLEATIYEAESLGDSSSKTSAFSLSPSTTPSTVFKKFLKKAQSAVTGSSASEYNSLYATVDVENARLARTKMVASDNSTSGRCRWNESFVVYCAHNTPNVVISIKNDERVSATLIGRAKVPASELISGYPKAGWFRLYSDDGQLVRGGRARVRIKVRFMDIKTTPPPPITFGIPNTFFKQRTGCRATLYHDAHVPPDTGPYPQPRCWQDVFEAINTARHLVYISGWSVYPMIRLIRDRRCMKPGSDQTLGELLKSKAEGGVRVLLLVWNDVTSIGVVNNVGVMGTHDQETLEYFANTKVKCMLVPRNPDKGDSIIQEGETYATFTHHQKTITVDAPSDASRRCIVSFVGGIDLCDGRYDTPEHSLFATLGTDHRDDFHQPNFEGASIQKGGPREPWHDIHSKLEGIVAWDVHMNFEQRWTKQAAAQRDLLLDLQLCNITMPRAVLRDRDPEAWNVQLFRSIDGGAADFNFRRPYADVDKRSLVSGKDNTFERSIQDAYITAIRRANEFIYIENQYFIGSSFAWKPERDLNLGEIEALNLIPKEISLKIVSKIEAGERFCVYIVIPMWPEGPPASGSVQNILYWQHKTMEMMYDDIAIALRAKQIKEVSPTDYLSFFCLCNKERVTASEYLPPERPPAGSDYRRAQENRRFMIYVHAKMMIVDDEYVIVGSANINQRSMDGERDSEIAMGGYQPNQLKSRERRRRSRSGTQGRGDVYRLRMGLWHEHMGCWDEEFMRPESLECMRKVKRIGENTRDLYVEDGPPRENLPAHLMSYPVFVTEDGNVGELPGFQNFPDTDARVLGSRSRVLGSDVLPPFLTT